MDCNFPIDLSSARFVVTGPSGWLGRGLLAWLADRIGPAWRDRVVAFGSAERSLALHDGSLEVRALESLRPADVAGACVIHFAYLGGEQVGLRSAEDFIHANTRIDDLVLRALEQGAPRGVFVSSSGMARQVAAGAATSLYGATKLMQEARFLDYARRTGVRTLVGRVFNVAGPYVNKVEAYALSSFLLQAFNAGVVRIAATVPVFRSYLHVDDLAAITIGALLADHPLAPTPVDLCGALMTEMQDVAAAAAAAAGLPESVIERGAVDWSKPSAYLGDPTATRALALRLGVRLSSFERQVADTAAYLRAGSQPPR